MAEPGGPGGELLCARSGVTAWAHVTSLQVHVPRCIVYTRVDTCDLCRHITEQYDERPHPELLPLVVELLLLPLQVTVATCVCTCLYTCVLQREFLRG